MEEHHLETCVRQFDSYSIVEVRGEIDVASVPLFKDAVGAATEAASHVIIDLSGVDYMDSSGFGTLLSATKKVRPRGGKVHLVGCNDTIERMLRITRLNTIFGLHRSEGEALSAVSDNGARANGSATTAR